MRHRILLTLILASAFPSLAQKGLAVEHLFHGMFHDYPNATETLINGGDIKRHKLSLYRSLTLSAPDAADIQGIERSVKQDGAHAISREVQFKDKRLYYGFYELPDRDGSNRYLFYLNQLAAGGNKVIVIYMEGSASLEQVKKMLK
ncbi:MAG: hypothetical protein JFR24_03890 [Muribaculaceae bacterium]|nr:hypothetical protein [Muribaculaceae bacterium]